MRRKSYSHAILLSIGNCPWWIHCKHYCHGFWSEFMLTAVLCANMTHTDWLFLWKRNQDAVGSETSMMMMTGTLDVKGSSFWGRRSEGERKFWEPFLNLICTAKNFTVLYTNLYESPQMFSYFCCHLICFRSLVFLWKKRCWCMRKKSKPIPKLMLMTTGKVPLNQSPIHMG